MQKFYIETVGCQMNVLDSELVHSGLVQSGLVPATNHDNADVILFNTCSIRQHAENKIYSALGRLKHWKIIKPYGVLGVIGCMAQKDQKTIFQRAPHVDLVLGPGQLELLPETVHQLLEEKLQRNYVSQEIEIESGKKLLVSLKRQEHRHAEVIGSFRLFNPVRNPEARDNRFQAMVRIMFGCDKFCTYCVVPSVRGPEQSRQPQEILNEIQTLVRQGVVEITLIGQTVNSYRYKNGEKTTLLADLLYQVSDIEGIQRICFVTNYPRGMNDDLLQAVRDLPKVAKHLHVPVQSGSDTVLRRMKRNYTATEYRELVDRIYSTIPNVSMTCDFIVGFCGETDEEFRKTVELVQYCRFKNSFIFKYSERPGTKSAELYPDDVPESVKKIRNNVLLEIQDKISLEQNQQFIGKTVEILVEGISKQLETGEVQLSGRTSCDRIVVFNAPDNRLISQFLKLKIYDAAPFTLFAQQSEIVRIIRNRDS
ncbi:MAG: tRNA (N6-isopentenyl adenosine(37)-C2)-methylthiotransferase MiaB [Planctomycetaceae bacterium]|jgi:tRNA-2-methylthio-N6-dimethylallyladenosine synthase|nr:tRNA (N6-isopentenyl adenosine(37)-C2)-methylthiotransferase MiaB [Planctomycetaceae bacterium]